MLCNEYQKLKRCKMVSDRYRKIWVWFKLKEVVGGQETVCVMAGIPETKSYWNRR